MDLCFRHWWLIVVAGVAVYLPLFLPGNELIYDDHLLLTQNENLERWGYWPQAVTRDYGLEFGERAPRGYWRPLLITLAIAGKNIFAESPYGYHAVSLAAHLFAAWLMGAVVVALLRWNVRGASGRSDNREIARDAQGPALTAALIYALHPLNTETVAFFTSLPDKLTTIFSLLAALALVRLNSEESASRRMLSVGVVALASLLALLSKESALFPLTALAATAALLAARSKGRERLTMLAAVAAMGGVAAAYFVVRSSIIDSSLNGLMLNGTDGAMLGRSLWSIALAGWLIVVPTPSHFFWPEPEWLTSLNAHSPLGLLPWLLVGGLFAALWLRAAWRGRPAPAFAWALMLAAAGALALTILVLPFAERYVLLAAPVMLVAIAAARAVQHFPQIKSESGQLIRANAIILLYLAACALQTFLGSAHYSTRIGFWTHAQVNAPQMGAPNWGLGFALFDLGQLEEAAMALEAGVALERNPTHRGLAAAKLAEALLLLDRPGEALPVLEGAKRDLPGDPNPWLAQVIALDQSGDTAAAKNALTSIRLMWKEQPDVLNRAETLAENLNLNEY